MSYLLATDVVIEAKRREPDTKVLAWLAEQPLTSVYLSVLTLGELQEGIAAIGDPDETRALQGWLEQLTGSFVGRILDVTPEVALTWGRLRANVWKQAQTAVAVDLLLVATAVTHNLTLVTRGRVEGELELVKTFNPWQQQEGWVPQKSDSCLFYRNKNQDSPIQLVCPLPHLIGL